MIISFLRIVVAQPLAENGALVGLLAAASAELLSFRIIRCAEGVSCSVNFVIFPRMLRNELEYCAFFHIFAPSSGLFFYRRNTKSVEKQLILEGGSV